MSIIENIERYMDRYDHLIEKQTRRYNKGKTLSKEEDEELQKLRPTVLTPLTMMFEILFDTVKTNQEIRRNNGSRGTVQHGGMGNMRDYELMEETEKRAKAEKAEELERKKNGAAALTTPAAPVKATTAPTTAPAPATATATATATAAAAAAAAAAEMILANSAVPAAAPAAPAPAAAAPAAAPAKDDDDDDAKAKEAQRLSELEESLLPLLTKIIVYIEENKKAEKKKDSEPEEEKYPDIGTSAKNSAILVVRKIKKWWNDLIQGGTSDLSSKINLKKAIPQLADHAGDMNKLNEMADKAIDAVGQPLKRIEKVLSNDVKDIASSSVEGIMNALSLIPGIGTTLQLWRLLQNVIVIMSKSVTTMAGAKTQGVELKTNIQGLQGEMEKLAADKATGAVGGATPNALPGLAGGGAGGLAAGGAGGLAAGGAGGLAAGGAPAPAPAPAPADGGDAPAPAPAPADGGGAQAGGMAGMSGGATIKHHTKSNRLRSSKKYKHEYKQSLREIRRTKKRIMKYFHNII
jgi:hypothetical protein